MTGFASSENPVTVGVIGCGAISSIYFENLLRYPWVRLAWCADLDSERAKSHANQYGINAAASVEELLSNPEIELVLNLTVPVAHAGISIASLEAGKHVYGEKPLATTFSGARQIMALAKRKGLRVGSAPDTFLGAAQQTARETLDSGTLGRPLAFSAFMLAWGVETWHPNPEFYYKPGGGPMFDMGPYYLTSLINMLGPVSRVSAMARINSPKRIITSTPFKGRTIDVEVPTHVTALLEFKSGPTGTLTTSFDVRGTTLPNMEIYGDLSTMIVPDPNNFGGDVKIAPPSPTPSGENWITISHSKPHGDNSRGIGLADMAMAIRTGRAHRANGELALHVVEIMEAVHISATEGRHIAINSSPERPAPMTDDFS